MESKLHYNTSGQQLLSILKTLMAAREFNVFRLVGGTALDLHKQRNPCTHDGNQIRRNFSNFENADDDFDPICLKGKYWEIIKLDIIDFARQSRIV